MDGANNPILDLNDALSSVSEESSPFRVQIGNFQIGKSSLQYMHVLVEGAANSNDGMAEPQYSQL